MRNYNGLPLSYSWLWLMFSLLIHSTTPDDFNERRFVNNSINNSDVDLVENQAKVVTLKGDTNIQYSYHLKNNWMFVVVQAHTQYRNVSLYTKYNTETYSGSDTSILRLISYKLSHRSGVRTEAHSLEYVLQSSSDESLQGLVAAVTYIGKSPVPGGCCLTCSLDVDPNLVISTHGYYKTVLSFSLANVYDYKTSLCSGRPNKKPDHLRLHYSVYQYFLEEGNLGDKELFDGLTKMLTPSSVKKHGKKVRDWNPKKDIPLVTFDTERGQGIVFNILIYDPVTNMESVYSPVVTYGCSFTAKVDGCDSLGSIVNIVLAVCGSILGLFICFFGHRFYQLYVAISGLTLFSFAGFILLTNETEWTHTVRMISSVCIGLVGAALLYLFWRLFDLRRVVLYVCGLSLGFLVAALLFFTPFGNLIYWKSDVNYWTVFLCITVTVPCVFLLCLKTFAILVASLVGAYGFVVGIDTFIRSTLSYIVLDVIMRATVDGFQKYDIPFQTKDYILVASWAVLALLGFVVQLFMSKGQETLRAVPKKNKRNARDSQANQARHYPSRPQQNTNEGRLPVLVNSELTNEFTDERLPILIEARPATSIMDGNNQRKTKYGTNIVC